MYCDRCGKQLEGSLNFCNACGAQLKKDGEGEQSILSSLITALIVAIAVGLGVLVALMVILLDKLDRFSFEPIFAFAFFYLVVLFGICFMIMRQISKVIDANLTTKEVAESSKPAVQLPPRSTNQLDEFREPASVVDQTTRTLDKAPIFKR